MLFSKSPKVVTKPKGSYKDVLPQPTLKFKSKGNAVKLLQKFLNWYCPTWKLDVDGEWGPKTDYAFKSFQKTEGLTVDGVYGKNSYSKARNYSPVEKLCSKMRDLAWAYGTPKKKYAYSTGAPKAACKTAMAKQGYKTKYKMSDCGNGVNTVVRESGVDKSFVGQRAVKAKFPSPGDHFTSVHKGKKIPSNFLKAGDIIRYKKKKNAGQHIMFYYGDGKICDCGLKNRFLNIRKDDHRYHGSNVNISTLEVLRVK